MCDWGGEGGDWGSRGGGGLGGGGRAWPARCSSLGVCGWVWGGVERFLGFMPPPKGWRVRLVRARRVQTCHEGLAHTQLYPCTRVRGNDFARRSFLGLGFVVSLGSSTAPLPDTHTQTGREEGAERCPGRGMPWEGGGRAEEGERRRRRDSLGGRGQHYLHGDFKKWAQRIFELLMRHDATQSWLASPPPPPPSRFPLVVAESASDKLA